MGFCGFVVCLVLYGWLTLRLWCLGVAWVCVILACAYWLFGFWFAYYRLLMDFAVGGVLIVVSVAVSLIVIVAGFALVLVIMVLLCLWIIVVRFGLL